LNYTTYFENAKKAVHQLSGLAKQTINGVLLQLADTLLAQTVFLLQENQKDLDRMDPADAKYDRLKLSEARIEAIAAEIRHVAALDAPQGALLLEKTMPNGLHISKIRVPLGVVAVIYEARPNVTVDVFTLCFKTGNVTVLKGSGDAQYSNSALIKVIHSVLAAQHIATDVAVLLPPERPATDALLQAAGYIDVVIPRGSQQLINFVRQNSRIPVIETGAGIVHVYGDETAGIKMLSNIVLNSKTRRPSVCNTLDCLLIHEHLLPRLIEIVAPLKEKQVEIFADQASFAALHPSYPGHLLQQAEEKHFGTEFLSLKMAIKTVNTLEEALQHIARYGSKHSESIVSDNAANIETFLNRVDAAAVYSNAATSFTDGAQFGLGAEIGISTQKLHARGPMGLEELTGYKWVVRGNGQVRE
jgi:glutamate-5-semialdehyde dehydrogenase